MYCPYINAVVKVLKSTENATKEEGESGVELEGEKSGEVIQYLVNVSSETETESEGQVYPGMCHPWEGISGH